MRWLSVLVILLLSLFLVASHTTGDSLASIQDIPSVSAARPSLPPKTERTAVDYEMSLVRTGLLGFGLLVFVVGAVRRTPKTSRARGLILLALALLSFASVVSVPVSLAGMVHT